MYGKIPSTLQSGELKSCLSLNGFQTNTDFDVKTTRDLSLPKKSALRQTAKHDINASVQRLQPYDKENLENYAPHNSPECRQYTSESLQSHAKVSESADYYQQKLYDNRNHSRPSPLGQQLNKELGPLPTNADKHYRVLSNITNTTATHYKSGRHDQYESLTYEPVQKEDDDMKYRTLTEGFSMDNFPKKPPTAMFLSPRILPSTVKKDFPEGGSKALLKGNASSGSPERVHSRAKDITQKNLRSIQLQGERRLSKGSDGANHSTFPEVDINSDATYSKETLNKTINPPAVELPPRDLREKETKRSTGARSISNSNNQKFQASREVEQETSESFYVSRHRKKDVLEAVNKTVMNINDYDSEDTLLLLQAERKKVLKLESKLASKEKLIEQLQGTQETYEGKEKSESSAEDLKKGKDVEIVELKKRNHEQHNQNVRLEQEILDLKKEIYHLRGESKSQTSENALTKMKEEYESKILKLTREKHNLTQQKRDLKDELEELTRQYQLKLQAHVQNIISLQEQIQLCHAQIQSRKAENPRSYTEKKHYDEDYSTQEKRAVSSGKHRPRGSEHSDAFSGSEQHTLNESLRELQQYKKSTAQFIECITDLVVECSPKNIFDRDQPTLKQTWKWIKAMMKDYVVLKKRCEEGKENEEIIKASMDFLKTNEKGAIVPHLHENLSRNKKLWLVISELKARVGLTHLETIEALEEFLVGSKEKEVKKNKEKEKNGN